MQFALVMEGLGSLKRGRALRLLRRHQGSGLRRCHRAAIALLGSGDRSSRRWFVTERLGVPLIPGLQMTTAGLPSAREQMPDDRSGSGFPTDQSLRTVANRLTW